MGIKNEEGEKVETGKRKVNQTKEMIDQSPKKKMNRQQTTETNFCSNMKVVLQKILKFKTSRHRTCKTVTRDSSEGTSKVESEEERDDGLTDDGMLKELIDIQRVNTTSQSWKNFNSKCLSKTLTQESQNNY